MKKIFNLFAIFGIGCLLWLGSSSTAEATNNVCSQLDSQLLISFQDNTGIRYDIDSSTTDPFFSLTAGLHPHEFVIVDEDTIWQANDTSVTPLTLTYGVPSATINVGGTPNGMTLGPDGAVYAMVVGPAVTRTETTAPYTTSTIITVGDGGFANEPFNAANLGIEFGPDGNLYVISTRDSGGLQSSIKRYDGDTFAYIDDFVAETAGDWQDFGFHTDGYLYVSDYSNGVYRYDGATGAYVDQYSTLTPAYSIKFSPDGNLLLTLLGDDVHLFSAPDTSTVVYNQVGPATKIASFLPPACYDWGDAADSGSIGSSSYSHPILSADNGARHLIQFDAFAGLIIDTETDGQPNATATGDDATDDEDGLTFSTSSFTAGVAVNATFTADGRGVASSQDCSRYLNVWVDLNGDGDWLDTGEQVIDGVGLGYSCTHNFSFTPTATNGPIMIRSRYSTLRDLAATGGAPDGEVEDYALTLGVSTPGPTPSPSPSPSPSPTTPGSTESSNQNTATPTVPDTGKKSVLVSSASTFGVLVAVGSTLYVSKRYARS